MVDIQGRKQVDTSLEKRKMVDAVMRELNRSEETKIEDLGSAAIGKRDQNDLEPLSTHFA